MEADLNVRVVANPTARPETRTLLREAGGDWLCAWCLNRVASDKDRFQYEGRDTFTFFNPDGIRFEIVTLSKTLGCQQTGVPTLTNTWFPEHAWSFCLCDRCGSHLGWYYAGQYDFVGLIVDNIVKSHSVWN